MSKSEIMEYISKLPETDRREIAERFFEEYGYPDDELSPAQVDELDRRAEEALAHPERCRPLDEVVSDLEKRFQAGK